MKTGRKTVSRKYEVLNYLRNLEFKVHFAWFPLFRGAFAQSLQTVNNTSHLIEEGKQLTLPSWRLAGRTWPTGRIRSQIWNVVTTTSAALGIYRKTTEWSKRSTASWIRLAPSLQFWATSWWSSRSGGRHRCTRQATFCFAASRCPIWASVCWVSRCSSRTTSPNSTSFPRRFVRRRWR